MTADHLDTADVEQARRMLAHYGGRRANADRARKRAMEGTAEWAQRAETLGLPITEIARLAGVTRQTVYDLLGR